MKLIVGLGNPGEKYEKTRHNVGFSVLEELKNKITNSKYLTQLHCQITNWEENKKLQAEILRVGDLILAKPTAFMNNSGMAVRHLATFYHIPTTNLWVIHDDLDIKLGDFKIQLGTGPKDHNGINSIYERLGSKDFWHVRVGIDNRIVNDELRIKGEKYVLQQFGKKEGEIRDKIVKEVVKDLLSKLNF